MFQHNGSFSSDNQGYQQTSSLSFAPQPLSYKMYNLDVDKEKAVRLQELFVEKDEQGNIRSATYDSGAQVRRHDTFTLVKSANNSLWMGDRFGSWHPLD